MLFWNLNTQEASKQMKNSNQSSSAYEILVVRYLRDNVIQISCCIPDSNRPKVKNGLITYGKMNVSNDLAVNNEVPSLPNTSIWVTLMLYLTSIVNFWL
ncbi:hypothetical protein NPIL_500131 [Nephila pilipes]|uniref:Uncharacterized protein n=1 Tax=Nephila pilipes TaxID=299642 RepID=A0A8X6PGE5_NEPPI|nr:hypothetical protein NPIL_500131 [Nephila pilipes]